jgi:hypothetical protein
MTFSVQDENLEKFQEHFVPKTSYSLLHSKCIFHHVLPNIAILMMLYCSEAVKEVSCIVEMKRAIFPFLQLLHSPVALWLMSASSKHLFLSCGYCCQNYCEQIVYMTRGEIVKCAGKSIFPCPHYRWVIVSSPFSLLQFISLQSEYHASPLFPDNLDFCFFVSSDQETVFTFSQDVYSWNLSFF